MFMSTLNSVGKYISTSKLVSTHNNTGNIMSVAKFTSNVSTTCMWESSRVLITACGKNHECC